MDLYSRKIIGWALRKRLTKELVIAALDMAVKQRNLSPDLLIHSDRGQPVCQRIIPEIIEKKWYIMFYEPER